MKTAFITDTHLGARGGSQVFREYFGWFYTEIFFPKLKELGITELVHLGDFFDNRNYVSLKDIAFVNDVFLPLLEKYNINMRIIAGNHDLAFKNTNAVTSLSIMEHSDRVELFKDEVVEFTLGDQRFAFVPWINNNNYDEFMESLNSIEDKKDVIVLGHFEIKGFLMYRTSSRCEHGLDQSIFKEFKSVWSGHFHHASKVGNIEYLGALFEYNWQDYGDPRGFWVYDSDKDEKEFIENEYNLFNVIEYTDKLADSWSVDDILTNVNNQFIKIIINDEYDKVKFMDFYSKVNSSKPLDVQVENKYIISSYSNTTDGDAVDEVEIEGETIESYVENYIDATINEDKRASIKSKMETILKEANEMMVKGE
ncbi:MAG: metallophosphoesterase [Nitrosopumilaceae archaeon]|nr:metallophosphoesterase [Nitrosopumilaceae archaeon]